MRSFPYYEYDRSLHEAALTRLTGRKTSRKGGRILDDDYAHLLTICGCS